MERIFNKPEVIFSIFSLVFGIMLILITPPNQAPDETFHFERAYSVAQGHFIAQKVNNHSGGFAPCNLGSFQEKFPEKSKAYKNAGNKINANKLKKALTIKSNKNRCFYDQRQQALYSPAAYIPNSAGILVSKIFTDSIYLIFITARIFSLLFYTILGYLVIKSIPFLKEITMLILLMPMSLTLGMSVSSDGVLIALFTLYFAKILEYSASPNPMNKKQFLLLAFLALWIALIKQSFILTLFAFFIQQDKFKNLFKNYNICFLPVIVLLSPAFLSSILWTTLISDLYVPLHNANPQLQMNFLLNHPLSVLSSFVETWNIDFLLVIKSLIGHLGAFYFPLGNYVYFLYLSAFFINLFCSSDPKSFKLPVFQLFALIFAYCLFINIVLYFSWVPPGASGYWEGLQGRYFIPVLLPFFTLLFSILPRNPSRLTKFVPFFNLFVLLIVYQNVFAILFNAYWRI